MMGRNGYSASLSMGTRPRRDHRDDGDAFVGLLWCGGLSVLFFWGPLVWLAWRWVTR